jgi:hypothetical protein
MPRMPRRACQLDRLDLAEQHSGTRHPGIGMTIMTRALREGDAKSFRHSAIMRSIFFCFAALLSSHVSAPAEWLTFEEGKSPLDDSPLLAVSLWAIGGAALVLQCKEHQTGAFFYQPDTYFGGNTVKIDIRVGDGKATEEKWRATMGGRAIIPENAVKFIRLLPENGRIFIRAHAYGQYIEGQFDIGNVSTVRNKIARACKWPPDSQQRQPN